MKSFFDDLIVEAKKASFAILDALLINLAILISLWLRLDGITPEYLQLFFKQLPGTTAIFVCVFYLFSCYKSMWEFASIHELVQLTLAVVFADVLSFGFTNFAFHETFPVTTYVILFAVGLIFVGGVRFAYRCYRRFQAELKKRQNINKKRIMIVGAGQMGYIVVRELINNDYKYGTPILMVDDNKMKKGSAIEGIPVKGTCADIPELAKENKIDEIIICIPSADEDEKKRIIRIAMGTGCKMSITPSVHEMASADFNVKQIRKVEISDLLSRPEIKLDPEVCQYLRKQIVLVTGGGGSIGSELCRQAARYRPKQIVIFDIYENNAYELLNELKRRYKDDLDVQVRIGSVRDMKRLEEVFEEFRPSVVFHAAAHKHVPLMEDSPCEAVKNNVFGTYNTAVCADKYQVNKFVLLSTDKAVNPTNVMGATKRITEMIIQYMNRRSRTCFAAVRFGNVLGSNGSVIPLFTKQIEEGGPVTVTDPDIKRFFMTIPEAAQLVVQAGGLANGGEIFVLDMGDQVKIVTLAENLIRLSGFEPYVDIDIVFTGLRPGEKMYEELAIDEELIGRRKTKNQKIYINPPLKMNDVEFKAQLEKLKVVTSENVKEVIREVVPNYKEDKRDKKNA